MIDKCHFYDYVLSKILINRFHKCLVLNVEKFEITFTFIFYRCLPYRLHKFHIKFVRTSNDLTL